MSKKIVVTQFNNDNPFNIIPAKIAISYENDKANYIDIFYDNEPYIVGGIYVAHVNDLVKNINAAFVEYAPGQKAYLSLEGAKNVFFINKKNTDKVCAGDNIVVQIKKDPIKTKDAVCSTNLEFAGKYTVITYGNPAISVSAKIKDELLRDKLYKFGVEIKERMTPDICLYPMFTKDILNRIIENTGIIFRTSTEIIDDYKIIENEVTNLYNQLFTVLNKALHSPGRTSIKEPANPLYSLISEASEDTEVITDAREVYDNLLQFSGNIRYYEDNLLPLYKLYSFETLFSEMISRKIWLKSGAYLIIDYTEAMTVIDVNTGKCVTGKNKSDTILKINLEAAAESMRQIKLRNVSGIIIIDFIDMTLDEHKHALLSALKDEAKKDKIKTSIMGMTRLNLVEITRQKIRERNKLKHRT